VLLPETVNALAGHDWPGNVRELQNVIASLAVRSPRRGMVPPSALPPPFHAPPASITLRLDDARRAFDERFVRAALVRTAGRRQIAARQLGLSRQGLAKLMVRLGIE
jgi:DNA-binding NtrC family response regulator